MRSFVLAEDQVELPPREAQEYPLDVLINSAQTARRAVLARGPTMPSPVSLPHGVSLAKVKGGQPGPLAPTRRPFLYE